jgi:hypothetical protein
MQASESAGEVGYYMPVLKPADVSSGEEKEWLVAQRISPLN